MTIHIGYSSDHGIHTAVVYEIKQLTACVGDSKGTARLLAEEYVAGVHKQCVWKKWASEKS